MTGETQQRTCVRNFCTNPVCQCVACTPRPFVYTSQRVLREEIVCTCTLNYDRKPR